MEGTNLCCYDELVSDASLFSPLPDEFFGGTVLTNKSNISRGIKFLRINVLSISRINEIATHVKVRIQELEARLLVHGPHP